MTQIRKVAVLGAGTMGHGIAQVCADIGCSVVLYDIDTDAVRRGMDRIEGNLAKGVSLGKVAPEEQKAIFERLSTSTSVGEAVETADLVIEAAPEVIDLKREIFAEVDATAPRSALLATNTSSLSIEKIAAATSDPSRLVGLHFFNPVHIMKLVEVVWGPSTSEETRSRAVAFVKLLGKEPIVVRDAPGFASSRLGIVLGMEAIRMVEDGVATPEDIDKAMELGYRHPMGPLKLTDLVGLDVRLGIADYLCEALDSEAFRPPQLLRRMVEEGKLGKKSGQGFYDWSK
jgi:3-hydroxybutyryl-CoA dehydrogenase